MTEIYIGRHVKYLLF